MSDSIRRHPRVDVADVLRGFAVLAIILLHAIEHFNFYQFPDPASRSSFLAFTDKAIWDGLFFMFGGKAYAIFALLFGFSFFIQHDNQRMRGNDFRLRFCWRLILLFIIGQFNAAFFTGEVLVLYSLVGFILVLTCRLSTRLLIILASVFLLQPACIYQILRALTDSSYEIARLDTSSFWAATYAVQDAGDFWTTVKVNLWEGQLASLAWAWDHGRVFQTAGLFIFGMLIGRNGWFMRNNLKNWGRLLASLPLFCFPSLRAQQYGWQLYREPEYSYSVENHTLFARQRMLHAYSCMWHYFRLLLHHKVQPHTVSPYPLRQNEHDQLCDPGHHRLAYLL